MLKSKLFPSKMGDRLRNNKLIFGILFGILAIGISSNQLAFAELHTPLFDCGTLLDLEGGTYTLQNDVDVVFNDGVCFDIAADNVTLDGNGFTISSSEECTGIGAPIGVSLLDPFSGATVKNLTMDGLDFGVVAFNSDNNTIENNKFLNNCIGGVLLDTDFLGVDGSSGNTVSDNEFRNNGVLTTGGGFQILVARNSNSNVITGNVFINGPGNGVSIFNSDSNLIDDNLLQSHEGIAIIISAVFGGSSENNIISNNDIFQQPGTNDGIFITDSSFNTITDNTLDGGANFNGEGEECDEDSDGISIESSSKNTVNDNIVRNWGEEGFELRDVSFSGFARNEVHNNCEDGFDLDDVDPSDIGSDNNTFTDNDVHDNANDGFNLDEHSDNNTFDGNQITDNGDLGISLDDNSNGNTITRNNIVDNRDEGIQLENSHDNTITLNLISGSFDSGIDIEDHSTGNTISCNTIINNDDTGIEIENHSHGNMIFKNQIEGNFAGLGFWTFAHDNEITNNNIVDNDVQIFDGTDGTPEDNTLSPNFWGDDVPSEDSNPLQNPVDLSECEIPDLPPPPPPEPEPEQVTDVICNIPEGTQTEINQSGDNIQFTFNATCDVTAGDSTEEIDVEITVDKDAEGLGDVLNEGDVDLNSWTEESFTTANWLVQDEGFTVLQTVNTPHASFFFGPFDAFDTSFTGQIRVETGGDDDFVGFVLGLQPGDTTNPDAEYLLIDWKQGTQTFDFSGNNSPGGQASKGLAVSRVSGTPDSDEFWQHADLDPNNGGALTELDRGINFGSTGWADFTTYEFTFVFTENNLKVFVNGVLEIDIEGEFSNGRIGFYNFSQGQVRYSGFNVVPILDETGTVTIEFLDGSGTLIIAEEGGILVDSEGPTYFIDGTSTGLVGTGAYENLTCEIGEQTFTAIDDNDSVSGDVSLTGCSELEPERKKSNGGMNSWDKRPTFGVSHEDLQSQIVENGFSFNGEYFTVTDNYHTDFAEQSVEIGAINTFSATVYTDKGLWIQEFLFGVPGVGEGHLAELGVEVWYDNNGEIDEVKVVQNSDVIDADTVSVSHEMTKCLPTDAEARCNTTTVSMTFLEPLIDKVMIIGAIDNDRRSERTSLNEGFDISGESLNPMLANMIPSTVKYEGLIKVTQVEKYSPYWVTDDHRMFEMNSFGSFKQINQSFERFQDSGSAFTRMHSGFGGIIAYEQNRALDIFDATSLVSELPESFAYIFPETHERITEEMRQEMLVQEEIAKAILDEMDRQDRHY